MGKKVLVFCHYIATGRALRQYISNALTDVIKATGARKLHCDREEVFNKLDNIGDRFSKRDSKFMQAYEGEMNRLLANYSTLTKYRSQLVDIIRRYLRTPSFLIRYFALSSPRFDESTFFNALKKQDASGLTLQQLIIDFMEFLHSKCGDGERKKYLEALQAIQTGSILSQDVRDSFSEDEIQGERTELSLPNVRLVNGSTKQNTRQKLMLTFNTPFYPDILVASSVMAEGVDLHLNCRHIIHHDLQRTGRIDRIGAKVERCGQSINVFLPYVSETQDEKMYRVVMDRERWFKIVMGEKYKLDTKTTDRLSERIPLPQSLAEELAFNLEI